MKRKNILILIFIITLIVVGCAYVYVYVIGKKNPDVENLKTDYKVTAMDMITEFEKNDTAANAKYNNKVVEISGRVNKTIPGDSITSVVMDEGKNLTITIEMYARYNEMAKNLKGGDMVTIKGLYIGYLPLDSLLMEFGEKGDIKLKKGSPVK